MEFYLLPLANRLEESGVFGGFVGKQFASTVLANRDRWVKEGQKVTDEIIEEGKKMVDITSMSKNACSIDDDLDNDLDPESGDSQTSEGVDEDENQPIDWIKVFMLFLIVLLLGVILHLSQVRKHPKTPPEGITGIWKINCSKLGKAVTPSNICKDGYLKIESDGHATFFQNVKNGNENGENDCFRDAPIMTSFELMKIGLSTLPFEEENTAIA